jgi:hypothetical protein
MAQERQRVDRVQAQLDEVREILLEMRMRLIEDTVIDLRDKREPGLAGKRPPQDRPKVRSIRPR